jgi:hypothetical protein
MHRLMIFKAHDSKLTLTINRVGLKTHNHHRTFTGVKVLYYNYYYNLMLKSH